VKPPAESLTAIERMNMVLGVAATAVSGLVWGARGMAAAAAGALLAIVNFWVIRRLGARAVARVASGASVAEGLLLVAALMVKMTVLVALVWLLVSWGALPVLPFTVGLSVFVVSIFFTGLFHRDTGNGDTAADRPAPGAARS